MDTRPNPLGPLLAIFLTVAIFAGAEYAPVPFDWYVRLLGFLVAIWAVVVTWQWAYGDWVDVYARYRQAAAIAPEIEMAKTLHGLDAEERKLIEQLYSLKIGVTPGDELEMVVLGSGLTVKQFGYYLDRCDNYKLISVRNYADRETFPNRSTASDFVNCCVAHGWALPARDEAQNEPAHFRMRRDGRMWNKYEVRRQFGVLLDEYDEFSRAQDAPEDVNTLGEGGASEN